VVLKSCQDLVQLITSSFRRTTVVFLAHLVRHMRW
jgi:hypothetical protein